MHPATIQALSPFSTKKGIGKIPLPLYDKGGDVSVEASKRLQSSGDNRITSLLNSSADQPLIKPSTAPTNGKPQPTLTDAIAKYRDQKRADQEARVTAPENGPVMKPSYMPKIALSSEEPAPMIQMPSSGKVPVFDEGGTVDVNDGKHELAIVQDGEKVLTPEQADQYDSLLRPLGSPASDKTPAGIGRVETTPTAKTPAEVQPTVERGTPQERAAIDADKKNAMGKGVDGMVQLGTAAIHENNLSAPKAPGFKPILSNEDLTTPTAITPQPTGRDLFKAKVAQYDSQYQQLMNKAAQTGDPQFSEKADRVKAAKEAYLQAHPWGAPESAQPGILGKLGHVAEMVLSRAPVSGPVMTTIPGSEVSRRREAAATQADLKEQSAENASENKTTKTLEPVQQLITAGEDLHAAQASGDQNAITAAQTKYDNIVKAIKTGKAESKDSSLDQQMLDAERQRDEAQAKGDTVGVANANAEIKRLQEARPHTSEVEKLKYQSTVSKLSAAGLSTNPNALKSSLQEAVKKNVITAQDAADANGYISANPSAATQVIVAGEKGDAEEARKKAGKYYTYTDEEGTHLVTGDKLPKDAEATPVKDPQVFMREAETGNVVQKSFNRLHQDIYQHPEIFDKAAARNILATTLDQVDRSTAAILVAGTGGSVPLPSGMGDMINTALQNNTLSKSQADALKQYIADYKSAKDKVIILQMEAQGGKIGRGNANQFKAIADQLPNGATPDSKTAVRQMRNVQEMHTDLMKQYPDRRGTFKKESAFEPEAAPTGATDEVVKDGRVIGHVVIENGKKKFKAIE
jgi:hypothetical protein